MNYYLMDKDFRLVALIETYESFIWTNRYYEAGDFELYVPASPESLKLYTKAAEEHYYIIRDDDDSTNCRAMMVNKIELVTDFDGGNHISVTGTCIKGLLSRRIIWGKASLAGDLESEIRRLVYEQAIATSISARSFPHLVLGPITGVTETINTFAEGSNLMDTIINVCKTKKVGWDIRLNIPKKQLVFTVFKGVDHSTQQREKSPDKRNSYVIFSPEYDNLLGTTYDLETTNYKNIALVGGELSETNERTGEVTKRDFSQIAYPYKKTTRNPSGYERFEIYVDGSDIAENDAAQHTTSLVASAMKTKGQQTLDEYKSITEITGEVVPNYTFNIYKDYYMGDLVSIQNEFKQWFTARVIEVVEVEEIGKKSITPKFSVENYIGKEEDNLNPITDDQLRETSKQKSNNRVIATGEARIRGRGRKPKGRSCMHNGIEQNRTSHKGDRAISVLNKVYPDEV